MKAAGHSHAPGLLAPSLLRPASQPPPHAQRPSLRHDSIAAMGAVPPQPGCHTFAHGAEQRAPRLVAALVHVSAGQAHARAALHPRISCPATPSQGRLPASSTCCPTPRHRPACDTVQCLASNQSTPQAPRWAAAAPRCCVACTGSRRAAGRRRDSQRRIAPYDGISHEVQQGGQGQQGGGDGVGQAQQELQ